MRRKLDIQLTSKSDLYQKYFFKNSHFVPLLPGYFMISHRLSPVNIKGSNLIFFS